MNKYTLRVLTRLVTVVLFCCPFGYGGSAMKKTVWQDSFEGQVRAPFSPEGWIGGEHLKPEDASVTVVTNPVADGKQALHIQTYPKKVFCMYLQHWPPVKPATVYTMSIQVMFNAEDGTGGVSLMRDRVGYDPYLSSHECSPKKAPRSGGFKRFAFTFMTGPSQTRLIQPHIYVQPSESAVSVFLDDLRLEEGGNYAPSGLDKPVPTDRLLSIAHHFPRPDLAEIKRRFAALHKESEGVYRGDGQWEGYFQLTEGWRQKQAKPPAWSFTKHPLTRSTTERVFGYLAAYAAVTNPLYLTRAREGLEYLLTEQRPDGGFVVYYTEKGDEGGKEYYETGLAGVAFVEGYRQFKDKRYLDAAGRVSRYAVRINRWWNINYNMFLIWAASRYAAETGDLTDLDKLIVDDKLRFTLDFQRSWGGWPEHNSKIGYHGINFTGLVALYQALPPGGKYDQLRGMLRPAMIAAVNRYIVGQCPHGGLPHTRGKPETARAGGFTISALICANTILNLDTRELIYGVMNFYSQPAARVEYPHWSLLSLFESTGEYLQWATEHPDPANPK